MTDSTMPLLINVEQLRSMLGISKRTVWRKVSGGQIPKPIRIGRAARWPLDQIRTWISAGCPVQDDRKTPKAKW